MLFLAKFNSLEKLLLLLAEQEELDQVPSLSLQITKLETLWWEYHKCSKREESFFNLDYVKTVQLTEPIVHLLRDLFHLLSKTLGGVNLKIEDVREFMILDINGSIFMSTEYGKLIKWGEDLAC